MKNLLFTTLFAISSLFLFGQEKIGAFQDLEVEKFAKKIETLQDIQIVDVRTPEEWSKGTIKDAILINFYDENFQAQISELDKKQPVFVYCASGGRSMKTLYKMKEMGFKEIYNLNGGISAWKQADKPLVHN